jgi:hypothetical protein
MFINDTTTTTKLKIERSHIIITDTYAPKERREENTATLYEELRKTVHKTDTNDS